MIIQLLKYRPLVNEALSSSYLIVGNPGELESGTHGEGFSTSGLAIGEHGSVVPETRI
jgi:hypothetical protein